MTTGSLLVFAIILAALVLFVWEPIPVDLTAIGIMVALMVLSPWTKISPAEGLSGFANSATITVLAMMILSEGVRRTKKWTFSSSPTTILEKNVSEERSDKSKRSTSISS